MVCEVRGDSVVLTPQSTQSSKEYVIDPISGLRISKRRPRGERVSSDMVRKVMEEFPKYVKGPRQVTDGHLLSLAQRHKGSLVTLDRSIPGGMVIP